MNSDPLSASPERITEEEVRRQTEMEAALSGALDDSPPSAELRSLRDVLLQRQKFLARDLDVCAEAAERERLKARLVELDEQISALDEEAKINQFVEETVKFSHEVRRLGEG